MFSETSAVLLISNTLPEDSSTPIILIFQELKTHGFLLPQAMHAARLFLLLMKSGNNVLTKDLSEYLKILEYYFQMLVVQDVLPVK